MMEPVAPTRREFVASSASLLGGGWAWLHLPALSSLAACARQAEEDGEPLVTFSAEEALTMRAFAARILPSDAELPGAEEAGAVYFADRALAGFFEGMRPLITAGLRDLENRGRTRGNPFPELVASVQDEVIREIEATPFFGAARLLVVLGVFTDPVHGGNRNGARERILRLDRQPAYQPPFGYYDAQLGVGGGA